MMKTTETTLHTAIGTRWQKTVPHITLPWKTTTYMAAYTTRPSKPKAPRKKLMSEWGLDRKSETISTTTSNSNKRAKSEEAKRVPPPTQTQRQTTPRGSRVARKGSTDFHETLRKDHKL